MAPGNKATTLFVCAKCGSQFQKWSGRCLECGAWGTLSEEVVRKEEKEIVAPKATAVRLGDTQPSDIQKRYTTRIGEIDRVLGGGLVPGSLILLGGEPGIGKSTLALMVGSKVKHTLYISGEESLEQIRIRATRLELGKEILFVSERQSDVIIATIRAEKPTLAIIDSIQTMEASDVAGEAGGPTQIRALSTRLLETAKEIGTAILIIGHVTKDGTVAGPKTLEHLVDTVLYFEGERHHTIRILRAVKNRFGSTDEIGMFEMQEKGLVEVTNPSELLLEERDEPTAGSIVTCLMEGTRPLLVEVQALVNKTVFGYPVRKASGFDLNRLHLLAAVLERRGGLKLSQYDIHINIVGGVSAEEPAADLAVASAIASAYKDKPLPKDTIVFGEVGLGGEVRSTPFLEKRVHECERLGMRRIISRLKEKDVGTHKSRIEIKHIKNIAELISVA